MSSTRKIFIFAAIPLLIAFGVISFYASKSSTKSGNNETESTSTTETTKETGNPDVTWQQTGDGWKASDTPPNCSNPLEIKSPTDVSKATAILYPGQIRGGNYKPHGGFRFDGVANDKVTVTIPMDAVAYRGSRYIEQGETQYLLDFIAPCGIMFRFDHLAVLPEILQPLINELPEAKVDMSQTTNFTSKFTVKAGDVLATTVGFVKTANTSFDWGVYDLRQKNLISGDTSWASSHDSELAHYAVCWFDLLSATDEAKVRALPAGDQAAGKTSDYCK